MSTFTLAISCFTSSNLPWFMDLTFQISVQYCSLQHRTLLPSPVTSTTGCCFCFGSITSFFLELFLHWSPVCFIDYTKPFDCVDHNKLWKILQEMGIPEHLTCLLRNLHACQEATVRTGHGTMDWLKIGKGMHQGCILSLCLFKLHADYIMWKTRLDNS